MIANTRPPRRQHALWLGAVGSLLFGHISVLLPDLSIRAFETHFENHFRKPLMTEPTKNKGGRPKNTANEERADDLGVSPRRLRQLIAQYGVDKITDLKELQLMSTRALVVLRTIRAEREKRALELERRELITHAEVTASGLALAEVLNRLTDEALTNWPTQLAGKNELQVRQTLDHIFREFNAEVRTKVEAL